MFQIFYIFLIQKLVSLCALVTVIRIFVFYFKKVRKWIADKEKANGSLLSDKAKNRML